MRVYPTPGPRGSTPLLVSQLRVPRGDPAQTHGGDCGDACRMNECRSREFSPPLSAPSAARNPSHHHWYTNISQGVCVGTSLGGGKERDRRGPRLGFLPDILLCFHQAAASQGRGGKITGFLPARPGFQS